MQPKLKRYIQTALAVMVWILIWQLASVAIDEVLFLPSPMQMVAALAQLVITSVFWTAVFTSLWRIALGFLLGLVLGVLLAALATAVPFIEILLRPIMQLVRTAPVASFIILALVWLQSAYLSTFISFLMVLPTLYNATLLGLRAADPKLLEMADVFKIGFWRKLKAVRLPALLPPLLSACELALGLCWKSGVAAEVIGLPAGTIGERLYQAKILLQMPQLFAWTAVIILVSWLFGKGVLALMRAGAARLQKEGSAV